MRNWNDFKRCWALSNLQYFYPTYEELKQWIRKAKELSYSEFLPYLWGIETIHSRSRYATRWKFLPYLWGIETSIIALMQAEVRANFYPTYEELKLIIFLWHFTQVSKFLPYLWGIETNILRRANWFIKWIFTLPMRNWNRISASPSRRSFRYFYPTYEELKQGSGIYYRCSKYHFYPTYEELKLSSRQISKRN